MWDDATCGEQVYEVASLQQLLVVDKTLIPVLPKDASAKKEIIVSHLCEVPNTLDCSPASTK